MIAVTWHPLLTKVKLVPVPTSEHNNSAKFFIPCFIAIFIVAIFSYLPAMDAPFYLDDRDSIVENERVQAQTLTPLIEGPNRMRILGYATLWLNHQISGLETGSYHWFNLAIHCINAVLVFWLALIILRTFNHTANQEGEASRWWALLIALLWLLHPLNSQTVIYVVQRLASIAALCFLLTAISYIQLRQALCIKGRLFYGALLLLSIIAGLHSKQNYVCVFAFLYGWELMTCSPFVRRLLLKLTATAIVLVCLVAPFVPELWQAIDGFTRDPNSGTRSSYFYTQTLVIWDYYWRLIFPATLQLEIDVPLKLTMDVSVGLALMAHIGALWVGFYLRKVVPLLLVGLLLFYSSHLVESFIIPIKDLAFEHRTYIGNVGLLMALVGILQFVSQRQWFKVNHKVIASGTVVVAGLFAVVIFNRATLWQDPIAFYANEVALSPEHARANFSYGFMLMKNQQPAQAEPYLKKAFDIGMRTKTVTASGINSYMTVLYQQGKYQQAAQMVMVGLTNITWPKQRSMLLANVAYGYIKMGYCDFAAGLLKTALKLNPANHQAQQNLEYCIGKR